MPVYTVHAPADEPLSDNTDRVVFVRDGFHVWAFVFGPFWLLVNRLWLAFIGYVVIVGALEVAMSLLGVSSSARLAVMLLIAMLMGIEAANIMRWSYSRRRWREIGLVVADDEELAERRFFERQRGQGGTQGDAVATRQFFPSSLPPSPPPSFPPPPPRAGDARDVIGLFPQPGGTR